MLFDANRVLVDYTRSEVNAKRCTDTVALNIN